MSKLTQSFVKSVTQRGTYQDGRGLMLVVNASGKYWVLRYQINRERRDMGLGSFPSVSVRDARIEADKNRLLISQGIDPLDRRAQEQSAARRSRKDTLRSEAFRYIKAHSAGWTPRYTQQWKRSLEKHIFPRLGNRPVSDISTDDIVDLLSPIWLQIPVTAERLRNRIMLILDASRARGLRTGANPARWRGHLDKLLPRQRREIKPMKSIPYKDLSDFMRKVDALEGVGARALQLIILTCLRSIEVLHGRWDEVDFAARVWTIPGERMKNRREHRVPLSDAALQLLLELKALTGGSQYIFPSSRRSDAPIALNTAWRALREIDAHITVHGFRSTFRTWAAEETHYAREVCELCISHTVANRTEAAYNRGDLLEKRRGLMQDWAVLCTSGLEPARLAS